MSGMSGMDGDSMNQGVISVLHFPSLFWAFVGACIAAFTLVNVYNQLLFRQRSAYIVLPSHAFRVR